MKDIYSPLDIDEEWDDMTPDMAGSVAVLDNPNTSPVTKLAVTSEVAPDLSGNDATSTLAPAAEVTAEAPADRTHDLFLLLKNRGEKRGALQHWPLAKG